MTGQFLTPRIKRINRDAAVFFLGIKMQVEVTEMIGETCMGFMNEV